MRQVAVIGASDASPDEACMAELVGSLLARNRICLLSGGREGVMEASCRGAHMSGGLTIGIVPGAEGNQFLSVIIKTRMNQARNFILVGSCDAVIAIGGKYGTLSEIAYALNAEIPVFGLFTWNIPGVYACKTPKEAVEQVIGAIQDLSLIHI